MDGEQSSLAAALERGGEGEGDRGAVVGLGGGGLGLGRLRIRHHESELGDDVRGKREDDGEQDEEREDGSHADSHQEEALEDGFIHGGCLFTGCPRPRGGRRTAPLPGRAKLAGDFTRNQPWRQAENSATP